MKTKNLILTGALFASLLTTSSCQKDLLDQLPNDRLFAELFWKTENDAILAVNAAYPSVLDDWATLFARDSYTDISHTNNTFGSNPLVERNSIDAALDVISTQWTNLYTGIAKTNFVLDNIDKITASNTTKRVTGEAKALRAFQYIKLAALYGDVPLVTKVLTIEEGRVFSRVPVAQIWDFVDQELAAAADLLPAKYAAADAGRVTKGAALALKARADLYAGRYQQAAAAAKAVMDLNVYTIYPSYADLFNYSGERSAEVILDRGYLAGTLPNIVFANMAPFGQINANTGNTFVPTKAMAVMYGMKNGKLVTDPASGFNPLTPYVDRDPRLRFSFYLPGDVLPNGKIFNSLPNGGQPDASGGTITATTTGFTQKKYISSQDAASPSNSGLNMIQIRYAEVLLTYAEAMIELNQIDQSVIDAVNKVRQRPDVNLPGLTVAMNQSELRDAVRRERTIELAFEGFRLFDIRRWKIGEKVIPGPVQGVDYVENGVLKTIVVGGYTKVFDPAKHYLWPIPANERILVPGLTQNPGY